MRLSKPAAGWIFWEFPAAPEPFEISISYIFNSLEDIWLWALDLAHGFLPSSLRFNEEGSILHLTASPGTADSDELRLTARRQDEQSDRIYFETAWSVERIGFIKALGDLFAVYFTRRFDAKEWANGHAVPELAGLLPWRFPARVARASGQLKTPSQAQVHWALVRCLEPNKHVIFELISNEDRLGFLFQLSPLRLGLARDAWHQSGLELSDVETLLFGANREIYGAAYAKVQDLFEELDMMRGDSPEYAHLAEEKLRERMLEDESEDFIRFEKHLLRAAERILAESGSGEKLAMSPGWNAMYEKLQLVEGCGRVVMHTEPAPGTSPGILLEIIGQKVGIWHGGVLCRDLDVKALIESALTEEGLLSGTYFRSHATQDNFFGEQMADQFEGSVLRPIPLRGWCQQARRVVSQAERAE